MIFVNLIKVGAIWLADTINRLFYPFEEKRFNTPADLPDLEAKFSKDIEANFKNQGWFLYQKPMPEDAGDEALFQGLYLGMRTLKGANIDQEFDAFQSLFHNDILIRGYTADLGINDTTSNDSATGALFALYCIWQYRGSMANHIITRWAQRICDSGYALTDLNGVPTKYGQLEDGWKTDPLRMTLLLALLSLAAKIDRGTFEPHYEKLYAKYREILPYPKVRLLWWDTDYDTHRAAIHLHILWELTRDSLYKGGLLRLHRITKRENNAWAQVLCSPVLGPEELNLTILNTFTLKRTAGCVETINSGSVETVKWGAKLRAKQTLPIWRRGSQDFFWQRNMFSLDEWVGVHDISYFHSGLDFLLAYWMAKRMALTSRLSGVIL